MSIKISNNLSIRVNLNQENTLCVERHFERKSVRPFDTKTASCAFCVSKGGGCFSRIGNQRSQWHFARNLSRPFDIKTASYAICVSKGSGCFSGIGNQRFQWHLARNLSRPFDIKTASCAFCLSKGKGRPYLTAAIKRKRAYNRARCVLIAVAAARILRRRCRDQVFDTVIVLII